jgi:hypothetical protein
MALDDETQAALVRLSEIRAAADEATTALSGTSHTQVSKRKLLSVTVGLSGELQGLTFNGEGYRKLPPVELAAIIVETVTAAREGAQEQATGLLDEVFPEAKGDFRAMTTSSGLDDFMSGLLRVAGDQFTDEEIEAFQKSWRKEF